MNEPITMSTLEAIYARRSVRSYSTTILDRETVLKLLAAAVQAPSAIDEEPWAFSVIQDQKTLNRLSDSAKDAFYQQGHIAPPAGHAIIVPHGIADPRENLFHNAGTLIVIWAKPLGAFVAADCWLAAENLMLAACAMGLGSCVIGSTVGALNSAAWKTSLGVPEDWSAVAPIIVGAVSELAPPVPRKQPEVISWH